jgi:hypothetical protein
LKIPNIKKKAGGVAQGVSPEFKPQYCKKKKKNIQSAHRHPITTISLTFTYFIRKFQSTREYSAVYTNDTSPNWRSERTRYFFLTQLFLLLI